jgi:hypothetical protein
MVHIVLPVRHGQRALCYPDERVVKKESRLMNKSQKTVLGTIMVAVILTLAGCPTRASIADITRDPGKFAGKEITITGTASDSFGAMGNGVFQVDDGTGRIWVFSQNFGVPGNGAKVAVTGRVEQGFSFGGKSYGVIVRETQQRH